MIANIWLKSISGWSKILPKIVKSYLIPFVIGYGISVAITNKIIDKRHERITKKLYEEKCQLIEEILQKSKDIEEMTARITELYDEHDIEMPQSVLDLIHFFAESDKED